MARVKQTNTTIKLYEIDTMAYLGVKMIRTKLMMLDEFINHGGLDYAKNNNVKLAVALERFDVNMNTSEITTLTKDTQANETWFRKSGFLDSSNNVYKLSPVATSILNRSISLDEYAMLILSKQWIKVKEVGKPEDYKDNLLAVIIDYFKAIGSCKAIDFVKDFGDYVLGKYSGAYPALTSSNSDAARYVVEPLLLSRIMEENNGSYSLNSTLMPILDEYLQLHAGIRDIPTAGITEEQYFNCFNYGLYDITFVTSKTLFETEYPNLFKSRNSGLNYFKNADKRILYGAPGTGKSFRINHELKGKNIPDEQVKRVTFYPDYTYNDFVGGLAPYDNNGSPDYKFNPGPFTEILRDAYDNPMKPYYLVIEEINRGNAAAIFGDIFQLLDRVDSGESKYTITNKDVCDYLRKGTNGLTFVGDRFGLPGNLAILCTMNTADQNVFVLDSAFKRRFTMEYLPIDFSDLTDPSLKYLTSTQDCFADKQKNKSTYVDQLFSNTDLSDYFKNNVNVERTWENFARIVNEKINVVNKSEETISEDKKLGPFFVTEEDLSQRKRFADKVLYYLKQDVFKYTPHVLDPSYQELYDRYVNKEEDIFEIFASTK